MEFKPRSERELAESRLWPKGIYDFEILEANEKLSQSSAKPMIVLKVKVSKADGSSRLITDYLVEQRAEKLRHAADACGILDRYNNGSLSDDDFRNKRGKLRLGVEKDRTKTYPDKNIIQDYVVAQAQTGENIGFSAFTKTAS